MSDVAPPDLPSGPKQTAARKPKLPLGCTIALFAVGAFVVVFIAVGILSSLMFPAFTGARIRVLETRAENDCYNLRNAVVAYFTEYRKYPFDGDGNDAWEQTDLSLAGTLLAVSGAYRNPRGIPFYTGRPAAEGGYSGMRNGVDMDPANPAIYDPWGTVYRVLVDTDYNNVVEDPSGSGAIIKESILVWSAGRDGDFDTWADNIKTWE